MAPAGNAPETLYESKGTNNENGAEELKIHPLVSTRAIDREDRAQFPDLPEHISEKRTLLHEFWTKKKSGKTRDVSKILEIYRQV